MTNLAAIENEDLVEPISTLALAIEAASKVVEPWPDDVDSLALLYGIVVTQRKTLQTIEALIGQRLLNAGLGDDLVTVESVGSFRRRGGSRRKRWEGAMLASRIAARVADMPADPETGEMLPPGVLCQKVADDLLACGGLDNASHSWRSGELKKRNINPNQYCDWEQGQASVEFVPVDNG